jgi:GH15 family glucan-1,4-alpha-glucosidase
VSRVEQGATESPAARPDAFPAIEDYGLIGDCGSAALVSREGAIEWLCLPRFDSPSLFGAILDRERGGHFRIRPRGSFRACRRYVRDTAVLETEFRTRSGLLRLRDGMVAAAELGETGALWPEHQVLREIVVLEGEVGVEMECVPRFDYGRRRATAEPRGPLGVFFQRRGDVVVLRSDMPLETTEVGVRASAMLRAGDRRFVLLAYDHGEPAAVPPLGDSADHKLQATIEYWRAWSDRCDYSGRYRDLVVRSAITLKLMCCASSGAVVAAPTTSLPERIGGNRNWDYRYCWFRDATFTLRVLFELGYVAEGAAFFSWMLHATHHSHARLHVLYSVFGGGVGRERILPHLTGYRGSRPVRLGNDAERQLQLDLYGALAGSAHEYVLHGGTLGDWTGHLLARVGDRVCDLWTRPDQGIWEVRSAPQRHVHSVAMCWVALDRLLAIDRAGGLALSPARRARFERTGERIRAAIDRHGWSRKHGSFVATFDGEEVDASLLLLGLHGYVDPHDPRMRSTFERIRRELGRDDLLLRYPPSRDDGLPPGEGAFGICSFWVVEYLARIGRVDDAEHLFERLCERANDLGLLAEEIEPSDGAALGNFPQAFSHVGLVSAALAIAEARGERPIAGSPTADGRAAARSVPRDHQAEDLSAASPK